MTRPRPRPLAWKTRELPTLDETLCTGCGLCVLACPTLCLEMQGPLPWLPRPLECVSCGLCALVCPATAIVLRKDAHDQSTRITS